MRDIGKSFPGVRALDGVTLDLYPGEVLALVGENGAGKSTLMKILAGAQPADSGEILIDGKTAAIVSPRSAEELGIGMIYQEFNLVPSLNAIDNIVHGYTTLEEESQHRNIIAWRPVVVDVLEGYATFPDDAFKKHVPDFYPLAVELLTKDLTADLRASLLVVLRRVGEVALGIEGMTQTRQRQDSVASRMTAEPMGDREADARRML